MFLTESQTLRLERSELQVFMEQLTILAEQALAGKGELVLEAGDSDKIITSAKEYEEETRAKLKEIEASNKSAEEKLDSLYKCYLAGFGILYGLFIIGALAQAPALAVIALIGIIILAAFTIINAIHESDRLKKAIEWYSEVKNKTRQVILKAKDKKVKERLNVLLDEIGEYQGKLEKKMYQRT
jgi:hypothetical protein